MTTMFPRGVPLLALLALAAGFAHASPGPCQYAVVAKLPIRYVGTPLIPAIDGAINGTPAAMAINSGIFTNFMTMAGAARHRLRLRETSTYLVGAGGLSSLFVADLADFSAGPVSTGRTQVAVIGETGAPAWHDATMGSPFLFQADLEIALADKQMTFLRPVGSGCKDAFLDLDPQAIVLNATYDKKHPNPRFSIMLNGHRMDAVISTGATGTFVQLDAARRAGLTPGSPNMTSAGEVSSIGANRVAHWRGRFDTLAIGAKTFSNPQVSIMDSNGSMRADVAFGSDFLRTHRVLFARSQNKVYISHTGGDPFLPPNGTDAWIQKEADAGNPDAEFTLARIYQSGGNDARAQASAWLKKAAGHGHSLANLMLGRELVEAGHYREAVDHLQAAANKAPIEGAAALWLYVARAGSGARDSAGMELNALFPEREESSNPLVAFFAKKSKRWPHPVADYLLGRIDADALLPLAHQHSHSRVCEAKRFIAEWTAAQGDTDKAASLRAAARESCTAAGEAGP